MNMRQWLKSAPSLYKPMPVLSFPGIQLSGTSVKDLVQSGALQADCMKAIAKRFDMPAVVSLMDLSVEAEAFGSPVRFSEDEVPTVVGAIVSENDEPDKLTVPPLGTGRSGEYVKAISKAKELYADRAR